jgi:transcriptional regulator with XRE-family HTH domain
MARLILSDVLKQKGLSKRQFAKLLGVRYENVFRLFHKGYNPRFDRLCEIAKALRCRVRDLIRE